LHDRLFDIRVIVRRGLQYVLARGVVLALIPGLLAILLIDLALHSNQTLVVILRERGWVYGILVAFAFASYSQRRTWLGALDRRFFREHYDAQQLVGELVENVRHANSFDQVASRAVARIEEALHPEFVALLVRDPDESAYRTVVAAPVGQTPVSLLAESKLASLMRVLGKPLDVSSAESGWLSQQLPREETNFVRQTRIELLIPIAMGQERKEALLILGPKRSEEPYTQEDQNVFVAIVGSLAILLERPTTVPIRLSDAFEECPRCGACYESGSAHCAQEGASLALVALPRALARRYQLNRRLGRGGMGTVYEAVDIALDRRVAVKVVREDLTGSPVAAERFRQEARVAASFTHPNVVTVYDFGIVGSMRAFLVMELLEGVTLREELRKHLRLTTPRTLEILRGVCGAIDSAHRRQLIHRDLKPENVFLVRRDCGECPKVLDFGLAKFFPTSTEQTIDTDPGVAVGTMRYMAPEQARGGAVDPTWDLWALTVMAYEMLTGANPFASTTAPEWYKTVLAGSFTPVSKHLPDSPGRWQQFFAQAFALDPAERPSSARMFLSQLERAFS
jgi:tRNA A-37 threonylcarbamoyl transferase component Bud32